MEHWREWLTKSYGKKLNKIHAWNAVTILLLTITGILLYVPAFRTLGAIRVIVKDVHIYLGVLSIFLILLYIPLIFKHLKQLKGKLGQRWNLGIVLFILLGWSLSGIVLWQLRSFPPSWNNAALLIHDLFTFVGVPYAIYHSITRIRWLKSPARRKKVDYTGETPQERSLTDLLYTRRVFIRWSIALVLLAAIGPSLYRWLRSNFTTITPPLDKLLTESGNRMLPPPSPMADSLIPIGGGYQGNFRIYTVTPIPSFSSDKWKFGVAGLVDHPMQLDWQSFINIHRKVQVSDFHCVTGWSVYKLTWEGIPLSAFLKLAGVQKKAKFVKFYSGDGVYTDTLSLEQAAMDDVMLAVLLDGKEIPQDYGGPVKLIVPKMYAYKSVKWLQSIELIEEDHIGYWEARGYDTDAWVDKPSV
ncbi:MAG TPA: molybdopterin-dependent oxidoreductase [Bacilli bacterium]